MLNLPNVLVRVLHRKSAVLYFIDWSLQCCILEIRPYQGPESMKMHCHTKWFVRYFTLQADFLQQQDRNPTAYFQRPKLQRPQRCTLPGACKCLATVEHAFCPSLRDICVFCCDPQGEGRNKCQKCPNRCRQQISLRCVNFQRLWNWNSVLNGCVWAQCTGRIHTTFVSFEWSTVGTW